MLCPFLQRYFCNALLMNHKFKMALVTHSRHMTLTTTVSREVRKSFFQTFSTKLKLPKDQEHAQTTTYLTIWAGKNKIQKTRKDRNNGCEIYSFRGINIALGLPNSVVLLYEISLYIQEKCSLR